MSDMKQMQLAVVDTVNILTMPTEEFIDLQMQPIQDDHWIRTEDIVHLEDIIDTEGGEKIKKEILQEYIGKVAKPRADPILEGMLYQEQFMQEYRAADHPTDANKAKFYRSRIMNEFRRKNPSRTTDAPMFGEEPPTPAASHTEGDTTVVEGAVAPADEAPSEGAAADEAAVIAAAQENGEEVIFEATAECAENEEEVEAAPAHVPVSEEAAAPEAVDEHEEL